MENNQTILVTGAAGFIGSHLCKNLLNKFIVVGVDDLSLGNMRNLDEIMNSDRFTFYKTSILSNKFDEILTNHNITVVYHFAANSDIAISNSNPSVDYYKTFQTTFKVLESMRLKDIKKIVFASTSAIYGDSSMAIQENFGPLFPHSHYGAAKLSSEAFISSYCVNYDFSAWIFRFPNVVGPNLTHGVIYDFTQKLLKNRDTLKVLGNGFQEKPYLHVSDLIEAINLVTSVTSDKINFYNIAGDTTTTVREIVDTFKTVSKINFEPIYGESSQGWIGDIPKFRYDTTKLKSLGWSPKYSSDQAVLLAIKSQISEWKL